MKVEKCPNQHLCRRLLIQKFPISDIYRPRTCVCWCQGDSCECWTSANTLWHQIRLFPLPLSSHRFQFSFPLLSRSVLSPLHQLVLRGFISRLRDSIFSLSSSPPLSVCIWATTPRACIHTKHTREWKWLTAEMYTVHEPILWLNHLTHTHTLFFSDWSYGSPRGLKWKPIKSDIFHFHLHIVTARRELQC